MRIEKEWKSKGLRCVIIMTGMGHRCGYVAINAGHPWHGLNYNDEISKGEEVYSKISVHGGLTFASGQLSLPTNSKTDGLWWFGFDCGHCDDAPDLSEIENEKLRECYENISHAGRTVRTLEYVENECESLVDQLRAVLVQKGSKRIFQLAHGLRGAGGISAGQRLFHLALPESHEHHGQWLCQFGFPF